MADAQMQCVGRDRIAVEEVKAAKDALLASVAFCKSPRMSRLLDYLVEQAIADCPRDTSEYAIGIAVFDRDPRCYSPGEDPVVRVQVGRLRTKLKSYYCAAGRLASIEIEVPLGCYMPQFRRRVATSCTSVPASAFSICPFKCVSQFGQWEHFALGLHEELTHLLYKNLGRRIILEPSGEREPRRQADDSLGHRLEGSVHVDAERIRASVRLIEVQTGCVAWSEQFDGAAYMAITYQEAMASSICSALQNFLDTPHEGRPCLRL
ncbi:MULTISPECIES: hypothetical protein [Pseudomonas]|jgi:TolB-like protein|uniref:TolB amino-terminal domain-containing protein n=1 Tax=Pseudomonas mosselii TaxID=78327 RepID=A0A5R8ZHQ5_9PSED|nr:hypothetical protein [Pseudomonas mosselii]TLP64637.1 hypothetical protein FEM01_00210 [Pseudomonas mosselii]